jgi:FKBP-type peptidyl-prolyl cis-trans isomerase SlyD
MIIANNHVVALSYTLRNGSSEGEIIEQTDEANPFVFIFGTGHVLDKFEHNLNGLTVGDKFAFMIESASGYGEFSEEAVIQVPKEVFMVDGVLQDDVLFEGNVVPLRDNEGRHMEATVRKVAIDHVVLDFNHPLAGVDLFFEGIVEKIRLATESELNHGHVHGIDGHDHHH